MTAACSEQGGNNGPKPGDGGPVDGDSGSQMPGDGGPNPNDDGGTLDSGMDGGPDIPGDPICVTECPAKACGYVADGCGDFLTCGGCPDGEVCGLFEPVRCGAVSECTGSDQCQVIGCTPKTCADLGHSCGLASDGCGKIINCWPSCGSDDPNCAGSCGEVSTCLGDDDGVQTCVVGSGGCTGPLCSNIPTGCASDSPTKLTGTVRTPGMLVSGNWINQLPVPNAIVYIPADPGADLPAIFQGVESGVAASCGRCEDEPLVAEGDAVLAAGVTDFKGEFTMSGRIPVGAPFKMVVKVGKWRRVVEVTAGVSAACESRALAPEVTRLAATSADGLAGTHLPKIAVSTGDVDAMECVLRGMGIAESEFTVPSGSGRIHMYTANGTRMGAATGCSGTYDNNGTPVSCTSNSNRGCRQRRVGCSFAGETSVADTVLYADQAALNAYDMVVFDCEGGGHRIRSTDERARVLEYTNAGGRVFASHWSYEWLDNTGDLDMAAAWTTGSDPPDGTARVSLPSGPTMRSGANPVKSLMYRDWLVYQGALTGTVAGQTDAPATPELSIVDPRYVAGTTVGDATDEWMYLDDNGPNVQQLSFNTPYGSADDQICGRVAFSAFHVATSGTSTLSTDELFFPAECQNAELTPQEKTLAFMLFDLGACVTVGEPPTPPICQPKTEADLCPNENDACGHLSDRCGGVVDCGACEAGYYCDGNTCRTQTCAPKSCEDVGYECGQASDGCGDLLDCGACPVGYCSEGVCITLG